MSVFSLLVAEWALLGARDARYLLPLSGLLVALAGVELVDLVDRRLVPRSAVFAVTAVMVVLGSLSMREFSAFNFLWTNPPQRWTEAKRLQQLLAYLRTKDVQPRVLDERHAGFAADVLQQRNGHLAVGRPAGSISRPMSRKSIERWPNGEPVAVVGYTNQSGAPGCWDVPICTGGIERIVANPESIFTVDDKYFAYVGADRELLAKLGFRFWD